MAAKLTMDTHVSNAAPPNYLTINALSKRFGEFFALKDISLTIEAGEFACFLGPSGCGKTTLLRCIAGLETQTSGTIHQNQTDISTLPPSARDFGIVFQSYALFPNLSVFANVGYGLVNKQWSKQQIRDRVSELLDMVNLTSHVDKFPGQLSGGEQQRVALARALATSPGLLLLDEPLSALDAKVRLHLRKQIKQLHERLGVTTIMVTHDQEEAQSIADRIFVMDQGEIVQWGTPKEIYARPNSPFIADFIGITNFIQGQVVSPDIVRCANTDMHCNIDELPTGRQVNLAIRPEHIALAPPALPGTGNAVNQLTGTIVDNEFLGSVHRLYVEIPTLSTQALMVDVGASLHDSMALKLGDTVNVTLSVDAIQTFANE